MIRREFISNLTLGAAIPFCTTRSRGNSTNMTTSPFLFVNDLGAVPDWTTDSTSAIQAAIDSAHSLGGGVVLLGVGGYKITQPITLKNAVHLSGMGGMASYIRTIDDFPALITATGAYNNISLSGFHIDMSANHTNASGIDFRRGLMRGHLYDIRVTTSPENLHGIILRGENPDIPGTPNQGQFNCTFDRVIVKPATNVLHQGYGLYLWGAPISDGRVNNIRVNGGEFEGGSGAIRVEHCQGIAFRDVDVEISNGITLAGASTWKILLENCWFDDVPNYTPLTYLDGLDSSCLRAIGNTGLADI